MGNLNLWRNPWRETTGLNRMMDQMLEDWPFAKLPSEAVKYGFNPSCEVKEDKMAFHIKVDIPGVPKENIKVDLHDNRLTITAERTEEKKAEEKEAKTHFSEVFYGTYTRAMTFPTAVDAERVEARYDSGVLNLVIPKKTAANSRQIAIK